jgi:capsular exopolysaccharide synthesis family protein
MNYYPGRGETLANALRLIAERWKILVVCVAICVAGAVVQHQRSTTIYGSTASVAFGLTTLSDVALEVNPNAGHPEREAGTNVLVARSTEVAAAVAQQLNMRTSPHDLVEAVSVEAVPNANVLNITVEWDDPAVAQQLANAFAEQYMAFKARAQAEGIDAAAQRLRQQREQVREGSARALAIEESLQRLEQMRAIADGNARIIDRAEPGEPVGLGLKMTIALAVVIGVALGLVVIFGREVIDRRLTRVDDFEREYGLPALSAVPETAARKGKAAERRDDLEPHRILRSALDADRTDGDAFTLLVTSAIAGEGKTSTAIDLAQAVALTGRSVVLVEMDLRRPTFSSHLSLDPRLGVTSVLWGRLDIDDVLVRPLDDLPNLAVIPSGSLPSNPSELLAEPGVEDLINRLKRLGQGSGRMVIIDAAPLLPVADTQVLLSNPAIDKVLLVARAGVTTRDDVRRARAILDRHLLPAAGIVVTGVGDEIRYGYTQQKPEVQPRSGGSQAPPERQSSRGPVALVSDRTRGSRTKT